MSPVCLFLQYLFGISSHLAPSVVCTMSLHRNELEKKKGNRRRRKRKEPLVSSRGATAFQKPNTGYFRPTPKCRRSATDPPASLPLLPFEILSPSQPGLPCRQVDISSCPPAGTLTKGTQAKTGKQKTPSLVFETLYMSSFLCRCRCRCRVVLHRYWSEIRIRSLLLCAEIPWGNCNHRRMRVYESASLAKCLDQIHPTCSLGSSWFLASHSSPFSAITSKICIKNVSYAPSPKLGVYSPRRPGKSGKDSLLRAL